MENNNIKPERITKPIQLLAVWLSGLILLVSVFLGAAKTINEPEWLPILFGITAVIIVPLVLILVFLLQTRFRPEMQEDTFYSGYLDKITGEKISTSKNDRTNELESQVKFLSQQLSEHSIETKKNIKSLEFEVKKSPTEGLDVEAVRKLLYEINKNEIRNLRVSLNKKLNNYNDILKTLNENNVQILDIFGVQGLEIGLITIGKYVSASGLKQLLELIWPMGISIINRTTLKHHENNVLIGSYAYKNLPSIPITSELLFKLDEIQTNEELELLIPNISEIK